MILIKRNVKCVSHIDSLNTDSGGDVIAAIVLFVVVRHYGNKRGPNSFAIRLSAVSLNVLSKSAHTFQRGLRGEIRRNTARRDRARGTAVIVTLRGGFDGRIDSSRTLFTAM
jgi:hypothetical protein